MRHLAAAALLLTLTAAGCNDSPTGTSNVSGTYSLQSVNGSGLPAVLVETTDYRFELTSGTVMLNSNKSFTATHSFRETDTTASDSYAETCTGSFALDGSTVNFSEALSAGTDCGGTYAGTVSGSTLTVNYGGGVQAVYQR